MLLAATAALEAARAGSGRTALGDRARVSKREAKRTVEVGEQVAQMPNVARGLAVGELNVEHAAVLADAARRTSPDAVDSAAELLEAAVVVSPETLRDQARKFAARHDPAAAESELGRQRRERCASLFVDESSGMGVLHAEFDPVSFALVRQALENYNDALWRLDGGRDGTPNQIRDNRQRLADSLFEIVTDRNALAAIEHPAAHGHNGEAELHRDGGDSDAMMGGDGDVASESPAGRSVDRWRPAQAPNQLVIIAEVGVIDGTKLDGTCELLGAGPVPPSILDNLSPDTRISGALFDTNGEILWLGRSRRHASVAQQLAGAVPRRHRGDDLARGGVEGREQVGGAVAQSWVRLWGVPGIRDRGCVLCRAPMHRCRHHHVDEWAAAQRHHRRPESRSPVRRLPQQAPQQQRAPSAAPRTPPMDHHTPHPHHRPNQRHDCDRTPLNPPLAASDTTTNASHTTTPGDTPTNVSDASDTTTPGDTPANTTAGYGANVCGHSTSELRPP